MCVVPKLQSTEMPATHVCITESVATQSVVPRMLATHVVPPRKSLHKKNTDEWRKIAQKSSHTILKNGAFAL